MIKGMEEKTRDEIDIIRHKNEAIEKEMKDLKAKNETIESRFIVMEKEIEYLKSKLNDKEHVQNEVIEKDEETANTESKAQNCCEKCEFVAKSESGLKTHVTVKHKTSMFKAYTKVSR